MEILKPLLDAQYRGFELISQDSDIGIIIVSADGDSSLGAGTIVPILPGQFRKWDIENGKVVGVQWETKKGLYKKEPKIKYTQIYDVALLPKSILETLVKTFE